MSRSEFTAGVVVGSIGEGVIISEITCGNVRVPIGLNALARVQLEA